MDDVGCLDQNNHRVLKLSNKFKEKMKVYQEKGYQLKQAKVKSIIYWKKENAESEILVLLPEIEWVKK